MPLAIPRFLQARDLLSISAQGGTLGASGITWATAIEMSVAGAGTGTWKAFEFNGNPNLANFMASDLTVANYQIEFEDFDFTVREITPQNGMGTLTLLATTYDFMRFDYVYRPRHIASGAGVRLIAVGTRGPLNNPFTIGENVQALTLKPVGYGFWVGASTDTPPI